jgi:hypothetical protein
LAVDENIGGKDCFEKLEHLFAFGMYFYFEAGAPI